MTDKIKSGKLFKTESGKNLSEIVKNVVTIIAIVCAGFWGYTKFLRVEAPSLEPRGNANSRIFWNAYDSSRCEAVFDVDFANLGHSSFDVTKLEVQAWKFTKPWIKDNFATYMDTDEVKKTGERIFEKPYSEFPPGGGIHMFIGHYPPGATFRHSFVFLVSKSQDQVSKAPGQSVYFEASYYLKNSTEPHAYTGAWSTVCDLTRPTATSSPTPQ